MTAYMQLYVGDYLRDTQDLTAEQHGAYLLILMTMWSKGGTLPNDPKKLARVARCTPSRWTKIAPDLMPYFTVDGGDITQGRLAGELEIAREKSIKRAQAGAKGGRAKSLKDKKATVANAVAMPQHLPAPVPLEENPLPPQGETKASRRKARVPIPAGFPDEALIETTRQRLRSSGVNLDAAIQAERFRNHAEQNDRRCADWSAAWRNWISKAAETAPKSASVRPTADPWRRRLREFKTNGWWEPTNWGPRPDKSGCEAPADLLIEFGFSPPGELPLAGAA